MMPPSNSCPPWGSLADDVLQEIFVLSVTGVSKHFGYLVLDTRPPPFRHLPQLSISHVCSTWRQVSFLTPRLWNRIYIRDVTHLNMLIATEWLSRARNFPVVVEIDAISLTGEEEAVKQHSRLISLLSLHRIHHLEILTDMTIFLHDLPLRTTADLQTLALDCTYFEMVDIKLSNEQYHALSYLLLRGNFRPLGACNSLRKFDASDNPLTTGEIRHFLSGCPSLEECYILIKCDDNPSTTDIRLPFLRILQLGFLLWSPEVSFETIIEPFSLPSLETFEMVDSSVHWSTPAFGALARRSNNFPHLETFILRTSNIMIEAGPLLALIPTVTSLSLCSFEASIGEAIFDTDTLNGLASGFLGPRLRELIVGHISNSQHFMDMVESRMENAQQCINGGAPALFTKVQFKPRERYPNPYSRLYNMRQRGIPI